MIKSSFFEYRVATSGLFSAQGKLQVTSHNIANAGTKGYTRQYAKQRATIPISYRDGRGMYGTGSELYGIDQIRNKHLDEKYRNLTGTLGEHSSKVSQMNLVEKAFNDLEGNGLNSKITEIFNELQELSLNPGDLTVRNNFLTKGVTFTELITSIGGALEKQQSEINNEIKFTVERINGLGKQISSLNEQIKLYELNGDKANDLRDQRELLVDELSGYVNVKIREEEKNTNFDPNDISKGLSRKEFIVQINGYTFVQGDTVNTLKTVEREEVDKMNPNDIDGLYDIVFEKSSQNFNIYSNSLTGSLKGLIDARDGNNNKHMNYTDGINSYGEIFKDTTEYKGIPHYMDKLNEFIRVLSRGFNEGVDYEGNKLDGVIGHIDGYDLYNEKGNTLFTYTENGVALNKVSSVSDMDYSKMTYKTFSMNTDMLRDPRLFSASESEYSDESNANVIIGFLDMQKNRELFAEGSIENYANGVTIEIGISVEQATKFESLYTDNVEVTENQRLSVSGVDLNEEMMLMMQYQQQYQASAKLINIIDGIYDTLINSIGR